MITENLFNSREQLYQSVASTCADLLTEDINNTGKASLIVPGGTTPAPVFERLSRMPLQWQDIMIIPSDERWIATELEQSNQYLIKNTLLINRAAAASFTALKNDAQTAVAGQSIAETQLQAIAQPFSATLLGMGNDGHFASLFPGCPEIDEALDPETKKSCLAINAEGCAVAGEFTQRMSLTMRTLINSKRVILLITGQEKLAVLRQVMQQLQATDKPVSALLAQNKTPVEICWAE